MSIDQKIFIITGIGYFIMSVFYTFHAINRDRENMKINRQNFEQYKQNSLKDEYFYLGKMQELRLENAKLKNELNKTKEVTNDNATDINNVL
jgi:hypothetical protein